MDDASILADVFDLLEVAVREWGVREAQCTDLQSTKRVGDARRRTRLASVVEGAKQIHEVDAQLDLIEVMAPELEDCIQALRQVRAALVARHLGR